MTEFNHLVEREENDERCSIVNERREYSRYCRRPIADVLPRFNFSTNDLRVVATMPAIFNGDTTSILDDNEFSSGRPLPSMILG